jgi:DNA (cytosine-5)-methyltransferase 1
VNSIATIDLFAGAGGLSLGAAAAGADIRLLTELDGTACETLRINRRFHGGEVLRADVAGLNGHGLRNKARVGGGDRLLIIGGAPCQPFSKAAYWTDPGDDSRFRRARSRGEVAFRPEVILQPRPDERRSLVQEFLRLVLEAEADAFVFENVPSLLHPRNETVLASFQRASIEAGFQQVLVRANAVEYGVPQRRERVFILAVRGDRPIPPVATHSPPGKTLASRKPAVSAGEALADVTPFSEYEPEEEVRGRWAEHLRTVPPGQNYKAHTAWGGHPEPTFETETRFWHFLLKLSPDLPSEDTLRLSIDFPIGSLDPRG